MNDITHRITQYLHFDMPGTGQKFLDIDIAEAEGRLGFRLAPGKGFFEVFPVVHYASTAATTTGNGFDNNRTIDLIKKLIQLLEVDGIIRSLKHRHPGFNGGPPCSTFVAKEF